MTEDLEKKRAALDAALRRHGDAMIALDVVEEVEQRTRRAVVSAALAISGEKWDARRAGLAPSGASREIAEGKDRIAGKPQRASGIAPGSEEAPQDTTTG